MSALRCAALLGALLVPAGATQAQSQFNIGSITTTQSCQYFMNTDYHRDTVAAPWFYASHVAWRSWWVKDCVNNFATMRSSLQAALASTGKFTVGRGGYRIDVTIGDVSGGGGAPDNPAVGPRGFAVSKTGMLASFTVTVKDASGRIIHGGLSSKMIETGVHVDADGLHASSSMTGDAVYGVMQNELALAIARIVAFNVEPLRVTQVDGERIRLNYGSPFLKLGTLVEVGGGDSLYAVKYNVVSSSTGSAVAEVDGDNDTSSIRPGATATMIEADDPAANGRRYQRRRLP
ncbi:MAG TPA: hypothetical protein PKD48_10625 [Sphingopyxis sp.]|nr:hypothetical protein [Sphingopyxis sp.]HMQ18993.1 hypothetical protein [Sphingopyxis sp.]